MATKKIQEVMDDIFDNVISNIEDECKFSVERFLKENYERHRVAKETNINIGTPYADANRQATFLYDIVLYKSYRYILNTHSFRYLIEILSKTLRKDMRTIYDKCWEFKCVQEFIKSLILKASTQPKEYRKSVDYICNSKSEYWSEEFFKNMVVDVLKSSKVKVGKGGRPPISDEEAEKRKRMWFAVNLLMKGEGYLKSKAYTEAEERFLFSDVSHKFPELDKQLYARTGAWEIELNHILSLPKSEWPKWYLERHKKI